MATLHVEQAIFSSDNNERMLGYQLVARSAGITNEQARELTRWSPSHGAILDPRMDAQCLIAFPMGGERIAIGRTMYGLPEYSGRGGNQTVTQYLITTRQHLAGYQNNVWKFWLVARSHGLLQWNPDYRRGLPSPVMMARWAAADGSVRSRAMPQVIRAAAGKLLAGRRVAVTDVDHAETFLREILQLIPVEQRLEISLSSGLRPSVDRPFTLQLLPAVDLEFRAELSSDQVAIVRNSEIPIMA